MSHPDYEAGQKPFPPDGPQGPVYYAARPEKTGRGCFFWGCITSLIVGGMGLLLMIAVVVMFGYYANKMIQEYTDTVPDTIPVVNLPEDAQKELFARWDAFRKALDDGSDAEITLNADEVNALIDRESELKGKVYATLVGDQVGAKISIPLGASGIPGLGGRYLNGNASFTVKMSEEGDLDVRLKDLEVRGKKMTPEVKAQLAGNNLAQEYVKNPNNRELIDKIRKIQIKDSKVFIQARGKAKDATKPDETKPTEAPKPKDEAKPGDAPKSTEGAKPADAPKTEDAPKKADEGKPADAPKKAAA